MRAVIATLLLPTILSAQEWSRFRGPNGAGVSPETTLPAQWTEQDYAWKTKLPGKGHSSPVLWGDKLFVTASDAQERRFTVCLNADDGKEVWRYELPGEKYKMHKRNSAATATPAADADHVYVLWATPSHYIILALDHAGKVAWQNDLGAYQSQHGMGVSPIVHDGLVIVANDQDGKSSLLAFDAKTGAQRWQLPRKVSNATYATPCVYQPAGKESQIIFTNWKHGITAVDPKMGKVSWEVSTFNPESKERSIVSPIVAGDLVIGTCGFTAGAKHFVAVGPESGKIQEIWRNEKNVSHMATPIAIGDWIFSFTELGFVTCAELKTGKTLWQERLDGTFSASPVAAGERIYAVADDGQVFVVKAAAKFELVSRQALGAGSQATPAIARGRLFFRTHDHVIALGRK